MQAGQRLLRENEDVRQIVPKVEDEPQVRVGLARAAAHLAFRAPIVRQDAIVRKSVIAFGLGAADAPVWWARLEREAHAWALGGHCVAELSVAHEVQRQPLVGHRAGAPARICDEVMLVIECHVKGIRYRPEPVEPGRVARDHDRRVRAPHHLPGRHRPLAPHSMHDSDAAPGTLPVEAKQGSDALIAWVHLVRMPMSHAAENSHGGPAPEAFTPQRALAEDLVELRRNTG